MPDKGSQKIFFLAAGVLLLLCLAGAALWLDAQNDQQQAHAFRHRWEYSVQPATVQDWMTFNYLNAVFKLPPGYLQGALGIQDARYPALSLRQYAQSRGIDDNAFLGQVKEELAARAASTTSMSP